MGGDLEGEINGGYGCEGEEGDEEEEGEESCHCRGRCVGGVEVGERLWGNLVGGDR